MQGSQDTFSMLLTQLKNKTKHARYCRNLQKTGSPNRMLWYALKLATVFTVKVKVNLPAFTSHLVGNQSHFLGWQTPSSADCVLMRSLSQTTNSCIRPTLEKHGHAGHLWTHGWMTVFWQGKSFVSCRNRTWHETKHRLWARISDMHEYVMSCYVEFLPSTFSRVCRAVALLGLGKNTYAVHVQPHAHTLLQPKISDDH